MENSYNSGIVIVFIGLWYNYSTQKRMERKIIGLVGKIENKKTTDDEFWSVAKELSDIGKKAIPFLTEALIKNNLEFEGAVHSVYEEIINVYVRQDDKFLIPFLEKFLNHPNYGFRVWATLELHELGKDIDVSIFKEALNCPNPYIRAYAINHCQFIYFIKDKDIMKLLISFLNDPDRVVRQSSAGVLGSIRDKSALPYLEKALREEKDERVRKVIQGAIDVLSKL